MAEFGAKLHEVRWKVVHLLAHIQESLVSSGASDSILPGVFGEYRRQQRCQVHSLAIYATQPHATKRVSSVIPAFLSFVSLVADPQMIVVSPKPLTRITFGYSS